METGEFTSDKNEIEDEHGEKYVNGISNN